MNIALEKKAEGDQEIFFKQLHLKRYRHYSKEKKQCDVKRRGHAQTNEHPPSFVLLA